jgi:hypothetical protein
MSQLPNVVIVMSRCSRSRETYGMRFEQQSQSLWVADWAFPVRESSAKKEGYDQNDIKGDFAFDDEYPGCPYCHSMGAIYCGRCQKVSCRDEHSTTARCGWCGFSGQIGSGGVGGLKAGGDV